MTDQESKTPPGRPPTLVSRKTCTPFVPSEIPKGIRIWLRSTFPEGVKDFAMDSGPGIKVAKVLVGPAMAQPALVLKEFPGPRLLNTTPSANAGRGERRKPTAASKTNDLVSAEASFVINYLSLQKTEHAAREGAIVTPNGVAEKKRLRAADAIGPDGPFPTSCDMVARCCTFLERRRFTLRAPQMC